MSGMLIVIVNPAISALGERKMVFQYARGVRTGKTSLLVAGLGLSIDWINFLVRLGMLNGKKENSGGEET